MEAFNSRYPNIKDLEICKDAILQLYTIGVVYRDLNKYNIVIKGKKAKFIDFCYGPYKQDSTSTKRRLVLG